MAKVKAKAKVQSKAKPKAKIVKKGVPSKEIHFVYQDEEFNGELNRILSRGGIRGLRER